MRAVPISAARTPFPWVTLSKSDKVFSSQLILKFKISRFCNRRWPPNHCPFESAQEQSSRVKPPHSRTPKFPPRILLEAKTSSSTKFCKRNNLQAQQSTRANSERVTRVTLPFTGPRRSTSISKFARPAAPRATVCYSEFHVGDTKSHPGCDIINISHCNIELILKKCTAR